MGTPICPLSLDQLEEQLCREQPWLRHDGHTSLPPRLLLEAAARAAKTEARRASGALAKAERAARNARAAAEAQHRRAADAEEAARIGLGAKSLMEAAAAAHEAAEREAAAAEAAKELAQRYHEAALSKSLAARYFWDGQMNDEDELQRQLQQAASKSAGRAPIGGWVPGTSNTAHFQEDSSEGEPAPLPFSAYTIHGSRLSSAMWAPHSIFGCDYSQLGCSALVSCLSHTIVLVAVYAQLFFVTTLCCTFGCPPNSGFTCSDFTSSRSSRAAHRVSRPEDFMDQEDMEVRTELFMPASFPRRLFEGLCTFFCHTCLQ